MHTGQHYDYRMSGIFFDGLDLPQPDVNLEVGSGSHARQTGAMLVGIEDLLKAERPDRVVVYGDTNSTLAGALAASKAEIPVAHIEAGLRSFNRHMPEEINRVVADHLSSALLCPSETAVRNLTAEGVTEGVHLVGDVMFDVLNRARENLPASVSVDSRFGLSKGEYLLATVHRSENTDDCRRLGHVIDAFNTLGEPVIFPVHPRTRKAMTAAGYSVRPNVRMIDPVGYLQMVALTAGARLVLTDSGGLQKEAYWLGTPCLTLRDETEWVETVETGWNMLVGSGTAAIVNAVRSFVPRGPRPALYGDGLAAERCVDLLTSIPRSSGRTDGSCARNGEGQC